VPGAVPPPAAGANLLRPDYRLGANDQILVRSNAAEIGDRPFRVNEEGQIDFPLIGVVPAAGMTVRDLEADMARRLLEYVREPLVSITVTQFRSEPVTFFGAFVAQGVYPLSGGRSLVEMLTTVGGLLPNASRRIRITRRAEYGTIPLPGAIEDPETGTSSVEISLDTLMQNINPAEDIVLQAYDVVTAETAQPVYVLGEVTRPAPIPLGGQPSISVTQALSTAGGFTPTAVRGKVTVYRPVLGTSRVAQFEIDMKELLAGRINDFPLLPNDLLFVDRMGGLRGALPQMIPGLATSLPYVLVSAILLRP
jgi:polysaccharide export outer membrane protein